MPVKYTASYFEWAWPQLITTAHICSVKLICIGLVLLACWRCLERNRGHNGNGQGFEYSLQSRRTGLQIRPEIWRQTWSRPFPPRRWEAGTDKWREWCPPGAPLRPPGPGLAGQTCSVRLRRGPVFESGSKSGTQLVEDHTWTEPRTSKCTSVRRVSVMNRVSLEQLRGVRHCCSVDSCLEGSTSS